MFVVPASDGTLWATSYDPDSSCRLGRSGLDGRILERRRPISCGLEIVADTALGLVATIGDDPAFVDPEDLSVLRRWDAPTVLHAVVGERVLLSTHGRFALVDPVTGDEVRLATPHAVGSPGPGALSPDGSYVAIEYRSPAQIMDLWLLDVATLEWSQAPSMPVHAFIKRPAPVWTKDGRLAVTGDFGTRRSHARRHHPQHRSHQPRRAARRR